jgi:hypothetical protein
MKYQCYQIAAGLDRVTWNRLVRDIRKGIRTGHKDTQAFVAALEAYYPEFDVDDETHFVKAFPGVEFSAPRFRVLRTYFKSLLEQFMVEMELEEQPVFRRLLLTLAMKRNGLHLEAERILNEEQARLYESDIEIASLEHDLMMEKERLDLHIMSSQRKEPYDWNRILEKLDAYSLSYRLQLLCAMLNEGQLSAANTDSLNRIQLTLEEAAPRIDNLQPLAAIYYHILCLLNGGNIEDHFPALEVVFRQHQVRIAKTEKMNIFGFLTNFLFQRDRLGDPKSLPALHRSFKVMHELDLVFGAGAYSVIMVRNITGVGARIGDIAWTTEFLQLARKNLPSPENENAFQYGSGYLAFVGGNYPEARKHLAQVEYADPFYRLANDSLLLRISYESHDEALFYSTHSALSRHLYRKEGVSIRLRKSLQNQLKAMQVLFELRWGNFDLEEFAGAKAMISDFENLANRDWLQAKVEELEELHS